MMYICAGNAQHSKIGKETRIPAGWKRSGTEMFCKACWKARYVLRAITFPIAGPLNAKEWPDLRAALLKAWTDTTRLSNWLMREYAKADRVRLPSDKKLWPAPNPYLYQFAREVCPDLTPSAVVAIDNTVKRKYNKLRLDMLWFGRVSLPSFKYPTPYPVPAGVEKSRVWQARYLSETEKVPIVSVPIGDRRFDLRLRGGREFVRQLSAFRQLVAGAAKPAECAIYRVNANESDNRVGMTEKSPAGGKKQATRIMIKLAMWLPLAEKAGGTKTLKLRRDDTCFLMGFVEDRGQPWILNADYVKSWIIGHTNRRQRMSEDLKYEKRWPARNRLQQQEYLELICNNHNNRLKTFCHTASKLVAEFAKRQQCDTVEYDATATEYLPDFPWFDFKTKLEYKLQERGIRLVVKGEEIAEDEESFDLEESSGQSENLDPTDVPN